MADSNKCDLEFLYEHKKEKGRTLFMAYVQYLVYKYYNKYRQNIMLNKQLCVSIKTSYVLPSD